MAYFITLEEAKVHLRVDDDSEDSLITALIGAAVKWIERETGIVCASERAESWTFDAFDGPLRIPLRPVKTGTVAVEYLDSGGDAQTLSSFRVVIVAGIPRIVPAVGSSWPTVAGGGGAITLSATVGYAEADLATKPDEDLRAAALLMIGHWFENREDAAIEAAREVPLTAAYLVSLASERRA